jgi:hypothetical protein
LLAEPDPAALRAILDKAIPSDPTQADPKFAYSLILRSNLVRTEFRDDLERAIPRSIADADAAFRLASAYTLASSAGLSPEEVTWLRAMARRSGASARALTSMNAEQSIEARRAFRSAMIDDIRDIVKLGPAMPGTWDWALQLAGLLEDDAADRSLPAADRQKLLREALGALKTALDHAPPEHQRRLTDRRKELQRKLDDM